MTVRTRFAPSPTGYLHIGGVRTALFNWLLARRHGGQFILRIDDTDASRHMEDAVELILSGFRWLGMDWDEGPGVGGPYAPYYQSERRQNYLDAIEKLISSGHAYPCLASTAEIDALRDAAKAAKLPFVYRGPNRDASPAENLAIYQDKKPAVRFKVPVGQTTVLEDKVRGRVEWQTDLLGDFTIARSGGDPLYNLASIVDDLAMKITHIVRAEEHLANTHPQLLIAKGLGATELPVFAHVPYVAAPGTKEKLSKRKHGEIAALHNYNRDGYLPAAILNSLARLGWSLDDHTELMALDQIIANFSLERVISSPAGLDIDKMYWMQDHYMRQLPQKERVEKMIPFLQKENLISNPATPAEIEKVTKIDTAAGERLKLLSDIVRYSKYFFVDDIEFDKSAVKNLVKEGVPDALEMLANALADIPSVGNEDIEVAVKKAAEQSGMGGKINHVLRGAITGQSVGAGVYDCVAILGKEKSVARLRKVRELLLSGSLKAVN